MKEEIKRLIRDEERKFQRILSLSRENPNFIQIKGMKRKRIPTQRKATPGKAVYLFRDGSHFQYDETGKLIGFTKVVERDWLAYSAEWVEGDKFRIIRSGHWEEIMEDTTSLLPEGKNWIVGEEDEDTDFGPIPKD